MRAHETSALIGAVIVCFAGCGGPSEPVRAASQPAPPPTAAPTPVTTPLEIVAQQIAGGLRVSYVLPRPATTFRFLVPARAVRNASWHMLTPELELVDDEVRPVGTATFDRFEVLITPDLGEHDRIYPTLFSMGGRAVVLNTQSLLGEDLAPIAIELRASDKNTIVSSFEPAARTLTLSLPTPTTHDKGHYVYLGEPAHARSSTSSATFVVAPNVPAWLRTNLDDVVAKAVPFFGEQLAQPLVTRPFILVAYPDDSAPRSSYRGDTLANGEVALRFRGRGWSAAGSSNADESRFLLHELVHLWNAELFAAPDGEHLAWLHEGSAEYLALVAARRLDLLTPTEVNQRIGDAVNRCIGALGSRSLVEPTAPIRNGFYTCGVAVQWLAELSVAPGNDAFTIWRNVFAAAARRDRRYDVETFLAEVARLTPPGRAPLLDFLFSTTSAPRDWTRLPALVAPHGVRLAPLTGTAWDNHRRSHALDHLLRESCKGPHGFFTFDDHVRLDTGDRCGALSGDPNISFVEGHHLFKALDRAYRAIEDKCRRSQPIRLRAADGRTVTATCAHPIPQPAPMFQLQ